MAASDGWGNPRLRLLRTLATVLHGFLLTWLIVFESGPNDLATIAAITGSLLVLLGYEAIVAKMKR